MEISIVHERDTFALYINNQYYGDYGSPVQAAQAAEDFIPDGDDKSDKNS